MVAVAPRAVCSGSPRARPFIARVISLLLLTGCGQASGSVAAQSAEFYTVSAQDTWQAIAVQYAVPVTAIWQSNGVTNPRLLHEGQRLLIPETFGPIGENILFTEMIPEAGLWWTALRSGSPPSALMYLNGWSTPAQAHYQNVAAPDMRGHIVAVAGGTAINTPTPMPPTVQANATDITSSNIPLHRSRLGIQGHFSIPDDQRQRLLDKVAYTLEFTWVKTQVDWSRIEYLPGHYSVELDKLDGFVDDSFNRGLNILLSVVKAPDWARATVEEDGPPTDYTLYYDFLRLLAGRYGNKVAAIEVWNEPNLRREWNGGTLSGAEYLGLLAGAYQAIKEINPNIIVISAGLAPTGVTNEMARNDRLFLREMYQAGLPSYADAVGVHPYGWANPPWSRCCGDSGGVPTHNDDPGFFFLNTIEDYRAIQAEFGDTARQLWATEFGWGTVEGLDIPVPDEQPFFAYVNQEQQGTYIINAFLMAQEWAFMGPMFLWNLNVAGLDGHIDANQAGYSIMIQEDRPRPSYLAIRDYPKTDQ